MGIPLQRKIKPYPQKKESLNINPLPSYPADILEQWNCYLVLFNNHINPARLKHGQANHIDKSFAFSHWIFFARTYVFTNYQATHSPTYQSFAFSHWIFFARTYVFTNYQATHSPTYQRIVGACVLVVSYPGNQGSHTVAGKSFLHLVIIWVHGFHEVANCCFATISPS